MHCRPADAAPSPGGCSPSPALPKQPTARARLASPVSKHTAVMEVQNAATTLVRLCIRQPRMAPTIKASKRVTHLEVHELLRVRALLQAARAEECRQACTCGLLSSATHPTAGVHSRYAHNSTRPTQLAQWQRRSPSLGVPCLTLPRPDSAHLAAQRCRG